MFNHATNGSAALTLGRPSGVAPVWRPYMILLVIVKTDSVGSAPRYVRCFLSRSMKLRTSHTAMPSTESRSFPKAGHSPSVEKETVSPVSGSRTGVTSA